MMQTGERVKHGRLAPHGWEMVHRQTTKFQSYD